MERTDTVHFRSLLKQYRIAIGLTQEALAERAGIGVRTIKGMEQGKRHLPREDTLHRLITALQLNPDQGATLRGALHANAGGDTASPPTNATLPLAAIGTLTPLIGRDAFVENVLALLNENMTRLMTLVGPPGVGKTRVALEVVRRVSLTRERFFDRIESIALTSLCQPSLVLPAIIQATGVREVDGAEPVDALERALRGAKTLLFLDNFEHLLDATNDVVTVLARCTGLYFLITSRAALRVRGEREMPVPPLPVPALVSELDLQSAPVQPAVTTRMVAREQPSAYLSGSSDIPVIAGGALLRTPSVTDLVSDLMEVPSVMLFVQRAQATAPEFALSERNAPIIAAICRQLDGLPLAIELAAARIRLFTPSELLTRLSNRLSILVERGPDLPSRQQTMRDAIEWSYLLLSQDEQWTFRQLGIFVGGCSLEAAEVICAREGNTSHLLNDLTALIANSLIHKGERSEGTSYIIMLETIRAYAAEQLDVHHERALAAQAHSAYYCSVVESQARTSRPGYESFDLKTLDDDYANLQAALGWAIDHQDVAVAERLVTGTWRYWYTRGILTEGRRWVDSLLDLVGDSDLKWVNGGSYLADPLDPSVPVDQDAEDTRSSSDASARSFYLASALNGAGMIAFRQGDHETAIKWLRRGLALHRWRGDPRGSAAVLNNLGLVAAEQGLHSEAQALHEESLALKRELGSDHDIAVSLNNLGCIARAQGQYVRATAYFEENLAIQRALGDTYRIAHALGNLGTQAFVQGDYDHAYERYLECLALQKQIGDRQGIALTKLNLAEVAKERGDLGEALTEGRNSLAMFRILGEPVRIVSALSLLATISYARRDTRSAQRCLGELLDVVSRNLASHRPVRQWALVLACLAYDEGLCAKTVHFLAAAQSHRANGTTWTPTEQRDYEACLEQSRRQLDVTVFDQAWEVASAWSWQDVLTNAREFLARCGKFEHEEADA